MARRCGQRLGGAAVAEALARCVEARIELARERPLGSCILAREVTSGAPPDAAAFAAAKRQMVETVPRGILAGTGVTGPWNSHSHPP